MTFLDELNTLITDLLFGIYMRYRLLKANICMGETDWISF